MAASDSPESLEIEVSDFGPIAEAKVEIRPLTVFLGPSNTGKSYLATLIYALHRAIGRENALSDVEYIFEGGQFDAKFQISPRARTATRELQNNLSQGRQQSNNTEIKFPHALFEELSGGFSLTKRNLHQEICRCFGVASLDTLIRRKCGSESQVIVRSSMGQATEIHECKITLTADLLKFEPKLPEMIRFSDPDEEAWTWALVCNILLDHSEINYGREGRLQSISASFMRQRALLYLARQTVRSIVGPLLQQPAFYLPASRTGLMNTRHLVADTFIENASRAGIGARLRPRLSGVLADHLLMLNQIDQMQGDNPRDVDLGKSIEQSMLGGILRFEGSKEPDSPRLLYRPTGWESDLTLLNVSSMVSELAPVVLYLRHLVSPGNVLIIEEPESHLHPALQVEFVRQLAKLVQSKVRIILTSHSEWLLEALTNIVKRSDIPDNNVDDSTESEVSLDQAQVGAWLFRPNATNTGSLVSEIRQDESGLYQSDFSEVAEKLHNDWANISSIAGDNFG